MNRYLEKLIYTLLRSYPVQINDQFFKGDPAHLFFWRIVNRGGFEPSFFEMLDQNLNKDSVYCDIGAWIGPTVLYASRICKQVYAFEPDGIAFRYLLKNIKANRIENILPLKTAISSENGSIKMASHGGKQGDSMSSMVNIDQIKKSFTANAITWQTFLEVHNPGKIDFIKMDIEGGEFIVIPGMIKFLENFKPYLHLSLHLAYLPEHERKEKLKSIFTNLSFYKNVLDENGQNFKPKDYFTKISVKDGFRAFLFIP